MNNKCPFCNNQRKKALKGNQVTGDQYYATCGSRSCISKAVGRSRVIPKTIGKKPKLTRNLLIANEQRKKLSCECGKPKKIGKVHCKQCEYLINKRNKKNNEKFNMSFFTERDRIKAEKERLSKIFEEVTKKAKKHD